MPQLPDYHYGVLTSGMRKQIAEDTTATNFNYGNVYMNKDAPIQADKTLHWPFLNVTQQGDEEYDSDLTAIMRTQYGGTTSNVGVGFSTIMRTMIVGRVVSTSSNLASIGEELVSNMFDYRVQVQRSIELGSDDKTTNLGKLVSFCELSSVSDELIMEGRSPIMATALDWEIKYRLADGISNWTPGN